MISPRFGALASLAASLVVVAASCFSGGVDRRAGRRLESLGRRRWRAYARRNWSVLLRAAAIVAGWSLLGIAPALLVYGPFGRGLAVGSLGTLTVGFLVWIVAEESGAIRAKHGAVGEQNTAKKLARLRRHGWHVRNDVLFDRFNVDHILVGPGGAFAVETKTTSGHWNFTASHLDPLAADALRQARVGARKIRLLLSPIGEFPVRPLLVCWGPDVIDVPGGWLILDGVVVIIGRQAREALPAGLASHQRFTSASIDRALEQIDAFILRRDRPERQRGEASAARRFSSVGKRSA